VRSDRFACFQPQPDPGGVWLVQYGAHNYSALRPVDEAGDCDGVESALKPVSASSSSAEDGGSNTGVVIAGGVVVLLLLAAGGFFAVRRRATAGERE
jgi:peptide/nickel transport system substrate-binding protein